MPTDLSHFLGNQTCVLKQLFLLLALLALLSFQAAAEDTFIPAAQRVDMVYDAPRDILYITSADTVLRYQLGSNTFLAPFQLSGNLSGIDLSPDGNTLAVADRTYSATHNWIHLINLQTGVSSQALFPLAFYEGGTYTVAFANDGSVLVTSMFQGSGWVPLRRYVPATGAASVLASVRQNSMVTSSGDGLVIGFAESNSSDGPWGRYRVEDGDLAQRWGYTNGTSWFNYEIGVNRNGTQFAIPTYGGAYVYDQNFVRTNIIGQYGAGQPIGVVYHPTQNIVYFAWATTAEVRAYDTTTMTQIAAYDFEHTFTHPGNWAFTQGRLKLSRDGAVLFATVNGGVRYLRPYAPLNAPARNFTVQEDYVLGFGLYGTTSMGAFLPATILTNPAHGTLSVDQSNNLTYRPTANYNGPDSFTYRVSYGQASAEGTVTINVTPVNDEPVADNQAVTTAEDTPKAIALTASDVEGDALTYIVLSAPLHGVLSGVAPNLIYTPAANYNGSDSFMFKALDGTVDSGVATVSLSITPVNDAPSANAQSVTTAEDTAKAIALTGSDIEGSPLTYNIVNAPLHGTLSGVAPNLNYTPAANYNGSDSFTFVVNDGTVNSNPATITLSVTPVNDAPVAVADTASTRKNTAVVITALANDSDIEGDVLTVALRTQGARGTVTLVGNTQLRYTPNNGFTGTDTFTYTVSDGRGGTAIGTVTVTVTR